METQERTPRQVIASIRSRLERWELEHLRELAKQLAEQLEDEKEAHEKTRKALDSAEAIADWWHDNAIELANDVADMGGTVGITKDGQIGITE